jgi:hypothetical protein
MRYTVQTKFSFGTLRENRAIIPDEGASIAVEFWTGEGWSVDSKSPITSPNTIYTKGLQVRLTPTGGGFHLEEGEST